MKRDAQVTGRRINTLLRYREIMKEFNKHDCRDTPITVIHRKYIKPVFHISRDTLYRIFQTPVDEELESLGYE